MILNHRPMIINTPSSIVGTDEDSLFIYDFNSSDTQWVSLGLSDKIITALTVQHSGAGPGEFNTVYLKHINICFIK